MRNCLLLLMATIAIVLTGCRRECREQVVGTYVYYDESVESVLAASRYYQTDSGITSERFPSVHHGQKTIQIHLLRFSSKSGLISSNRALDMMAKRGLRPAEAREILSLGASNPDLQRQGPILALAPSCPPWLKSGGRTILCLGLDLYCDGDDEGCRTVALHEENTSTSWSTDLYRFAAVEIEEK